MFEIGKLLYKAVNQFDDDDYYYYLQHFCLVFIINIKKKKRSTHQRAPINGSDSSASQWIWSETQMNVDFNGVNQQKKKALQASSFSYLGFKHIQLSVRNFPWYSLYTLCGIEGTVLCIKIGGSKSEIEQSEYTGSPSFMATADHPIWHTK